MHLLAIGLNHKTAPVELREKLSFTSSAVCAFLAQQKQQQPPSNNPLNTLTDDSHESVIISTCNRLEYYALTPDVSTTTEAVVKLIGQISDVSTNTFQSRLYTYQDEVAVDHLMRVSSGLDSMVLGEAQILGQVVQAHQSALAHQTLGPILSRLFEKAIHAGKRARTETDIGLNPASISSIAIRLAQQHLGDFSRQTVMILGAGEMGQLALKTLVKQDVKELLVVNRTKENADNLAAQWSATPLTFDQLDEGLQRTDLIITSTAAPHIVLYHHQVAQIMAARPDHPLLIVDIALPRDVETSVEKIPNVHLYNIDHLESQIAENLQARQHEIPKVETIIQEETTDFLNWYCSLKVVPTITTFRRQIDAIRRQELERALNRLPELDENQQKMIAELSHRLMNKFLHQPTVRLRDAAANGDGLQYASALHELFDLDNDPE